MNGTTFATHEYSDTQTLLFPIISVMINLFGEDKLMILNSVKHRQYCRYSLGIICIFTQISNSYDIHSKCGPCDG